MPSPRPKPEIERWLPVVGYEGLYEVSDMGRVRSVDRIDSRGHRLSGRQIAPVAAHSVRNTQPYWRVGLSCDGRKVHRMVHHLVLEAFIGSRPGGMEACHRDDDPANNQLANLRWDTPRANARDKGANRGHYQTRRSTCPRGHALLTPNLDVWALTRGQRTCRACTLARDRLRKRGMAFDPSEADRSYRKIMEVS